jgi:NADH-quinone oxidoreductase subunit G
MADIEIEIDGNIVNAKSGEMLIAVTDREGISVPRFCYHKKLSIAANCRMCLVDVEGAPKPQPACSTPIADGMKIHTQNEKAKASQKAVK